ncbi:hypothetical protein WJ970_15180 [Achromobacter xylosoxidans]
MVARCATADAARHQAIRRHAARMSPGPARRCRLGINQLDSHRGPFIMNAIFLLLADVLLILAGVIYGVKFLRKRNYLCGIEWFIMALSGSHFLLWALFGWESGYSVAHFFDAFSRSFGFPVVAVAGMMAVTHNYQPSRLADVLYFLLGFAGAAALVAADHAPALAVYKPPFYLLMGLVFLVFLAYFAWRLQKAGETLHAMGTAVVALSGLAIAVLYDYVPLPGDDADRTLFYTAALFTWTFMMAELYYGYSALERATQPRFGVYSSEPIANTRVRRHA